MEALGGQFDDRSEKYAKMVNWIAREIQTTTLQYLRIHDMVSAIGLPREKLFLHCGIGE
jgi:amidophosphoribosyltransferase